ncbi:MAG: cold shock and DUF1294 domain-containing protein [Armatimonadetes bacterium]|nr:cold shock and DUF1294 domain-containing protein [Armatimonadota bacterium]
MSTGPPVRYQGEIVEWSDDKGFGFVRPRGAGAGDLVFLPKSAFVNRKRSPCIGDTVLYEVRVAPADPRRRRRTDKRAALVTYVGEDAPLGAPRKTRTLLIVLGLVFWAALSLAGAAIGLSHWPGTVSVLVSALSFLGYGVDKLTAVTGGWRIAETTLHTFDVLGGWPGGAIGQAVFQHKTVKVTFLRTYYASVVVNVLFEALVLGLITVAF